MRVEVRWYKGKYQVLLLVKSNRNFGVEALEPIPQTAKNRAFAIGERFVTYKRLCHRQRRREVSV